VISGPNFAFSTDTLLYRLRVAVERALLRSIPLVYCRSQLEENIEENVAQDDGSSFEGISDS
jgi:hypothetical protein